MARLAGYYESVQWLAHADKVATSPLPWKMVSKFSLALRLVRDSVCAAMQLIYTAFACEDMDGTKLLLPGYPAHPNMGRIKPGDKIKVELADGTTLETTVRGTQPVSFDESMIMALKLRASPGFYIAIVVPEDFSASGIELGAKVYLVDPA